MNQGVLFTLADNAFSLITNYEKSKNVVETAIALDGNCFAVAYGEGGMKIFSINFKDNSLKV